MPSHNSLPLSPLTTDVRGASKMLGLSEKTVGTWARTGRIPSAKLGARRLYSIRALEDFLAEQIRAQPIS